MSGGRAHLDRGSLAGARCWRYPHVFSFVYAGLINPFFYVTTVRTMGSRSRTRQATTGIRADRSANRAASGHRERRRRGCGMEPPHHRRRSSRGCRRGERNSKRSEPLGHAREGRTGGWSPRMPLRERDRSGGRAWLPVLARYDGDPDVVGANDPTGKECAFKALVNSAISLTASGTRLFFSRL